MVVGSSADPSLYVEIHSDVVSPFKIDLTYIEFVTPFHKSTLETGHMVVVYSRFGDVGRVYEGWVNTYVL